MTAMAALPGMRRVPPIGGETSSFKGERGDGDDGYLLELLEDGGRQIYDAADGGSTATIAAVITPAGGTARLWVAAVGDSSAILIGRKEGKFVHQVQTRSHTARTGCALYR